MISIAPRKAAAIPRMRRRPIVSPKTRTGAQCHHHRTKLDQSCGIGQRQIEDTHKKHIAAEGRGQSAKHMQFEMRAGENWTPGNQQPCTNQEGL
jgi:hypothetical protein